MPHPKLSSFLQGADLQPCPVSPLNSKRNRPTELTWRTSAETLLREGESVVFKPQRQTNNRPLPQPPQKFFFFFFAFFLFRVQGPFRNQNTKIKGLRLGTVSVQYFICKIRGQEECAKFWSQASQHGLSPQGSGLKPRLLPAAWSECRNSLESNDAPVQAQNIQSHCNRTSKATTPKLTYICVFFTLGLKKIYLNQCKSNPVDLSVCRASPHP